MPAWLIWTCAALLSWGVWAVLSKLLGDALSGEASQALSTLGMLPLLVVLTKWKPVRFASLSRRGLIFAFLGGVITCLGNVTYYSALAQGAKAAAVVPLTAMYPVVTVLLAVAVLRERLSWAQPVGLLLSLVAIWLFNVPEGQGILSPAVLHAMLPILFWGISGFLQKIATNHLPPGPAALVYLAAFVPVAVILAMREPWGNPVSPREWALVLALGFFLAFGNVAVLTAFAKGGKAAVITPLGGLYPIISVPVAVLFLGETVREREWWGVGCALLSVAALSWERTPAAAVAPLASKSMNP